MKLRYTAKYQEIYLVVIGLIRIGWTDLLKQKWMGNFFITITNYR